MSRTLSKNKISAAPKSQLGRRTSRKWPPNSILTIQSCQLRKRSELVKWVARSAFPSITKMLPQLQTKWAPVNLTLLARGRTMSKLERRRTCPFYRSLMPKCRISWYKSFRRINNPSGRIARNSSSVQRITKQAESLEANNTSHLKKDQELIHQQLTPASVQENSIN